MPDYTLNDYSRGIKWGSAQYGTGGGTVPYSFATTRQPGEAFTFSPLSAAMQAETKAAFAAWSAAANIDFELIPDSQRSNTVGIRVGLASIDGAGNVEGLTRRKTYSDATIQAAQIAIDSAEGWQLINGKVYDRLGNSFYHIILHEIGHALGLNHYDGGPAIMNTAANAQNDLQTSDLHGIQYIYGARGNATPGQSSTFDLTVSINDLRLRGTTNGVPTGAPGDNLGSFEVTIRSTGSKATSAGTIGVYLSTDPTISTSDRLLTNSYYLDTIPPYGTVTYRSNSLNIPTDLAGGTYYVGLIVDDGNYIREYDDANNASNGLKFIVTGKPGAGPDFIAKAEGVTDGRKAVGIVSPGQSVYVNGRITNVGALPAAPGKVGYYLSTDATITTADRSLGDLTLSNSFGKGQSAGYSTQVTLPGNLAQGTYYLGFIPNYDQATSEGNAANNASVGMKIRVGIPDMDLSTSVGNLQTPQKIVAGKPGGYGSFDFTFSNASSQSTLPGNYAVYISKDATITTTDRLLYTGSQNALVPAKSAYTSNFGFEVPTDLAAGTYYIGMIADYDDKVVETNEANNASKGLAFRVYDEVAPVAIAGAVSGSQSEVIAGRLTATDADDPVERLTYSFGKPVTGMLYSAASGNFYYDTGNRFDYLMAGQKATVTLQFTAFDGIKRSAPKALTITVFGKNDPLFAQADLVTYAGANGAPLTIAATTLTRNDIDADRSDTRAIEAVTGGTYGSVSLVKGNVVYTPSRAIFSLATGTGSIVAQDSFQVTVRDKAGSNSTATTTVNLVGRSVAQTSSLTLTSRDDLLSVDVGKLSNVTFDTKGNVRTLATVSGFDAAHDRLALTNLPSGLGSQTNRDGAGSLQAAAEQATVAAQAAGKTATFFDFAGSTYLASDRNGSGHFDKGDGLVKFAGTQFSGADAAGLASMNRMAHAMAMMAPSSSADATAASAPAPQEHSLAAAHA